MIQMELFELKNMMMEMAIIGSLLKTKELKPALDKIAQRHAYMIFGEAKVKRWVSMGLVKPTRSGTAKNCKKLYSLADLTATQVAENQLPIINQMPVKPCNSSK